MRQTWNDAGFDRVADDHDDWNILSCLLRRKRGRDVERHDNIYLEPNEFSREFRKSIQFSFRGAKLEYDVLSVRVAEFK